MKYQTVLKTGLLALVFSTFAACGSTQNQQVTESESRQGQDRRGQRPTTEQLITQMDSNKDGVLSKDEVKGPIAEKFSEIDTNNDGFLSKEEIENAPKPERRGGGERGGRR